MHYCCAGLDRVRRSEEAHQAQEDLASTVAVVQQLQQQCTISSARLLLTHPATSTSNHVGQAAANEGSVGLLTNEGSTPDTGIECEQHSSLKQKQARLAAAGSSKQNLAVPRPARSPAVGPGPAAEGSGGSSSKQTAALSTPSKARPGKAATPAAVSRDHRAAALSLRSAARAAAAARGNTPVKAAAGRPPGNPRRLLGGGTAASSDSAGGTSHQRSQQSTHALTAGPADQQHKQQQHMQGTSTSKPPLHASQQSGVVADTSSTAAAPTGATLAQAASLGQLHAEKSTGLPSQQDGCDTLASSLSVSAGPDAMLGLTRQQLHQVLQRPWLQETPGHADQHIPRHHSREAGVEAAVAAAEGSSPAHSAGSGRLAFHDEQSAARLTGGNSCADERSMLAVIESTSSGIGSIYNSQLQHVAGPQAADSSSSASPGPAAGDTGSSATQHQQRKGRLATACSSNGSSWPNMKPSAPASAAAAAAGTSAGGLPALPPVKPSPIKSKHSSIRLRGRSRAQPQQLSTSLESAATLPLQGPPGKERTSQSSSVADAALQEAPAAAAWMCNSLEMVQEEQQHWHMQQQAQHGLAEQPSSITADSSAASQGMDQPGVRQEDSDSAQAAGQRETVAAAAEQGTGQLPKPRRRWAAPSPPPEARAAEHQHAACLQDQLGPEQQQKELQQERMGQQHSAATEAGGAAGTPAAAAALHQALSKKHLQALAADVSINSSGELSAATSDLACLSVTSAATGCTTLSGLAGVYLQHPSKPTKACPRPSFVPQLQLHSIGADQSMEDLAQQPHQSDHKQQQKQPTLHAQQQEQQEQQQQQRPVPQTCVTVSAASSEQERRPQQQQQQQQVTPCSSRGHQLGSARSYLTAEELEDIAPLMAHPSSSRARRHSSTAGGAAELSVIAGARPTAAALHATRCTPRASRSSAGSAISSSSSSGHVPAGTGGTQDLQVRADVSAGTAAGTAVQPQSRVVAPCVAGEGSGVLNRSVGGTSTRAYRPSSGGGSNAGLGGGVGYWGSSAGSYPASENPSRQPTPRVSDNPGAAPSTAGAAGNGARGGLRSRPSTAGNAAQPAAGVAAGSTHPGTEQPSHAAAGAAGGDVPAAAAAAAAASGAGGTAAPTVTSHGVVLTAITPPCAASATAAAATSFMTMRPAHLYRSVSTGEGGGAGPDLPSDHFKPWH